MVAGHSGQFTPDGYLSTATLAGIDEPTTFRLLVRRATSRATETTTRVSLEKVIFTGRHVCSAGTVCPSVYLSVCVCLHCV